MLSPSLRQARLAVPLGIVPYPKNFMLPGNVGGGGGGGIVGPMGVCDATATFRSSGGGGATSLNKSRPLPLYSVFWLARCLSRCSAGFSTASGLYGISPVSADVDAAELPLRS